MEDERTEFLKPLSDLILEKSGLLRSIPLIYHLVEERIAQNNSRINTTDGDEDSDDEDPSTAWYGGATYDDFFIIKDDVFESNLETELSQQEKDLLTKLCTERGLFIQVVRSDISGQSWRLTLSVPIALNVTDSARFELVLRMSSLKNNRQRNIEAYTLDNGITKERVSKVLTAYSLQL